jgi:hypothetical protein
VNVIVGTKCSGSTDVLMCILLLYSHINIWFSLFLLVLLLHKPLWLPGEPAHYKGAKTDGFRPAPVPSMGKTVIPATHNPRYCSTNVRGFHLLARGVLVSKPRGSVW